MYDIRYFTFVDPSVNANKFWEIWLDNDVNVCAHWRRIGTSGQSRTWSFATKGIAVQELHKMVSYKLNKGYREVTGEAFVKRLPDDDEPAIDFPKPPVARRKTKWSQVLDQC